MKRLFTGLMLVMLLSLGTVPALSADPADKECRDNFELHVITQGDPDHGTHHGDVDRNGDGRICVKHLPNGKHLHKDNKPD